MYALPIILVVGVILANPARQFPNLHRRGDKYIAVGLMLEAHLAWSHGQFTVQTTS